MDREGDRCTQHSGALDVEVAHHSGVLAGDESEGVGVGLKYRGSLRPRSWYEFVVKPGPGFSDNPPRLPLRLVVDVERPRPRCCEADE